MTDVSAYTLHKKITLNMVQARNVSDISTLWYWIFVVLFLSIRLYYAPAFLHSSCYIEMIWPSVPEGIISCTSNGLEEK